ncbi:adenylate kinase [Actinopolymorpha alba]|uniref:adenylate kinase n=1 Tax=Actinopolymorpha alba TaxID=533267 RepID=UPI00036B8BA2|nr:adenylate kinase [Actinopolymorpha alba]
MRLLIMGPPGAGKGTQAKEIARRLQIPAISTGEILRANVEARTLLGREASRYLDAGELVPDEVINGMVRARLDESDSAGGFLLDGYPRTLAQVDQLDKILADKGVSLDRVLVLTVEQDELVSRLLGRAEQDGRSDDSEDVIRRRLEVYREQTEPLLDVYAQRGLLVIVNGMGDINDVTDRVVAALEG